MLGPILPDFSDGNFLPGKSADQFQKRFQIKIFCPGFSRYEKVTHRPGDEWPAARYLIEIPKKLSADCGVAL
jgi:hypothetical protein